MNDWFNIYRKRGDGVPAIWIAIALSLLVHFAVMWGLPRIRLQLPEASERDAVHGPLTVQLIPPVRPAPAPAPPPPSAPQIRLPKATARPQPAPPVIALDKPAPPSPPPAAPAVTTPPSARPRADGDLASYIEARRRARAESAASASASSVPSAPPVEDETARSNRIAAANIAGANPRTFGYDPSKSGGIFQIERMSYDYAEFVFFGWNKQIRRNTSQLIEVNKGGTSDIRVAVVRRMIAIIREHEQEDFLWESQRLGRNLTLSARVRDSTGLEDFLLREFFPEMRRTQ